MSDGGNGKERLVEEIEHLRSRLGQCISSEQDLEEAERALEEAHERISTLLGSLEHRATLQERYQRLADSTFEGLVLHKDGRIVDANRRVEEMSGYTREDLIGSDFYSMLEPDAKTRVAKMIKADGESPYEITARGKDGTLLELEVLGKTIPYEGSTIRVAAVRDIGQRKAAEVALRRSEEKYRLLAENVEDIIFTLSNDLTFNYVSPSFVRLTGYSVEELVEMGWQGLFYPDALEQIMEWVTEDAFGILDGEGGTDRSSVMVEAELTKKDGTPCWIEVNVSTILDDDGNVREMLGVARDVSERKASEERFIEEKRRAELYLDLFGHDIRNINQGIMSYLELMLMRPGLEPDEADYIKAVLEQATRINDLVAKVQRLTQLRSQRLAVGPVDAEVLIHAAIDYVIAKYPYRDVRIGTSTSCSTHVVTGHRMIADVFTSILDNAVRFNRNDTVEVEIMCQRTEDGDAIQFIFEDRGPGIADDTKDKVFRRLEQPEGGVKGSGLGLTVVWEIMRQLDGRVWVEDRVYGDPSQGSRFVVELPQAEDDR
jgi:PAS domain S-box-containing protein